MKWSLIALLLTLSAAGCATKLPPDPVTVQDIIDMSNSELTDADIIREIDRSRTIYYLSADDVVKLHEAGVSDVVIDFMLETRLRRAVEEERRRQFHYRHYYYDPLFYPGYYYRHYPRYSDPKPHFPPSPRHRK